jgi:hypothetical protein
VARINLKCGQYNTPVGKLFLNRDGTVLIDLGKMGIGWQFSPEGVFQSFSVHSDSDGFPSGVPQGRGVLFGCPHVCPDYEGVLYETHILEGLTALVCPVCVQVRVDVREGRALSMLDETLWKRMAPQVVIRPLSGASISLE